MALQQMVDINGSMEPGKYAIVINMILDKGRGYACVSTFENKAQRDENIGYPPEQVQYDFPLSLINGPAFKCVYDWLKLKEEFAGWVDA